MVYFEKRKYKKEEIAAILGIKNLKDNFKRSVETKLANLGFTEEDYQYIRGGDVVILWIPQTSSEKIQYLVRLLGIDSRVNTHDFAMFLYGMAVSEDLQCMPWPERSDWLKFNWNVDVSDRTLRKWTSKLIELEFFTKEKREGVWWCTAKVNGESVRDTVESEEDINYMHQYWEDWRMYRETMAYKDAFSKLWDKYQCTFYKCPAFLTCAWNLPIVEELCQVVVTYVQDYWETHH